MNTLIFTPILLFMISLVSVESLVEPAEANQGNIHKFLVGQIVKYCGQLVILRDAGRGLKVPHRLSTDERVVYVRIRNTLQPNDPDLYRIPPVPLMKNYVLLREVEGVIKQVGLVIEINNELKFVTPETMFHEQPVVIHPQAGDRLFRLSPGLQHGFGQQIATYWDSMWLVWHLVPASVRGNAKTKIKFEIRYYRSVPEVPDFFNKDYIKALKNSFDPRTSKIVSKGFGSSCGFFPHVGFFCGDALKHNRLKVQANARACKNNAVK